MSLSFLYLNKPFHDADIGTSLLIMTTKWATIQVIIDQYFVGSATKNIRKWYNLNLSHKVSHYNICFQWRFVIITWKTNHFKEDRHLERNKVLMGRNVWIISHSGHAALMPIINNHDQICKMHHFCQDLESRNPSPDFQSTSCSAENSFSNTVFYFRLPFN